MDTLLMLLAALAVILSCRLYQKRKKQATMKEVMPLLYSLAIVLVAIWILTIYNGFFR